MKIAYYSVAPFVSSGFGVCTRYLAYHLAKKHDVDIYSYFGYEGAEIPFMIEDRQVKIIGGNGTLVHPVFFERYNEYDVQILHFDGWVISRQIAKLQDANIIHYAILDHDPIQRSYIPMIRSEGVKLLVPMTNWGKKILEQSKYVPKHKIAEPIPHGADPNIYYPEKDPQVDFIPDDIDFLVVAMVDNNGIRENVPEIIEAFALFLRDTGANAFLYMNTEPIKYGGYNLYEIIDAIEDKYNVKVRDKVMFKVTNGYLPSEIMRKLYCRADCLINTVKGGCLTPDVKVFTKFGAKRISEIKEGDLVLTRKGFKRVKKVFKRPYEGKIIKIKTKYGYEVKLTPDHKVLAVKTMPCRWANENGKPICKPSCKKYGVDCKDKSKIPFFKYKVEWIPAKDLTTNHFVVVPKIKTENKLVIDISQYLNGLAIVQNDKVYPVGRNQFGSEFVNPASEPINRFIEFDEDFATLVGWYLAEGGVSKTPRSPDNINNLSISNKNLAILNELKNKIANVFGVTKFHITEHPKEGYGSTYQLHANRLIARIFANMFSIGSKNKRMPDFIIDLPKDICKRILEAYIDGDGTQYGTHFELATASEELAYQLALLARKVFGVPSVEKMKHGVYRIRVYADRRGIWEDENAYYIPIKSIEIEHYKGYVYDLCVEDAHEFDVGFIVHNSFEIPIIEAGLCETPSIATDWGATGELLGKHEVNVSNNVILKERGIGIRPVAFMWMNRTSSRQAVLNVEDITLALWYYYSYPERAKKHGRNMRKWVLENATWDIVGEKWLKLLDDIEENGFPEQKDIEIVSSV